MAHIFHGIESNVIGMQMINGFAQCTKEKQVNKYFIKGGELAKGIVKELTEIVLQDDIPVPATAGGNVTTSTLSPFSNKIMIYCVSLFCSFSLGGNSLGTAFSLRNDLSAKFSVFMKDIFEYAHEGAKIMIKYGWLVGRTTANRKKGKIKWDCKSKGFCFEYKFIKNIRKGASNRIWFECPFIIDI